MSNTYTIVNPQGIDTWKKKNLNEFHGLKGARVILFDNTKPNTNYLYDAMEPILSSQWGVSYVGRVDRVSSALKKGEVIIDPKHGKIDCAIVAMAD